MTTPSTKVTAAHLQYRPAWRYTVSERTRSANSGSALTRDSSSSARIRCSWSESGTTTCPLGSPHPSAPHVGTPAGRGQRESCPTFLPEQWSPPAVSLGRPRRTQYAVIEL